MIDQSANELMKSAAELTEMVLNSYPASTRQKFHAAMLAGSRPQVLISPLDENGVLVLLIHPDGSMTELGRMGSKPTAN